MKAKKIWNQASLLEFSTQKRLARKSVFNLRGFNKVDYFPSYISEAPSYQSFLISPNSLLILIWSTISMFLILFQSIYIPFLLSFQIEDYSLWYTIDTSITCFFLIDIILIFNSSIYKNGNLVQDRRQIAKEYLKRNFFIDFLAILPYFATPTPTYPSAYMNYKKYLNIIRLLKLLRLVRIDNLIRSVQDQMSNRFLSSAFMLFEIVLRELYVSHVLACGFFVIGTYEAEKNGSSWLTTSYFEKSDTFELYITSLYWSITTMCTVGYGDIKPQSNSEIVFVIFSMIVACIMFGYVIGAIEGIVMNHTYKDTKRREMVVALNSFMKKHTIPQAIKEKAKAYLKYIWELKSKNEAEENEVFEMLSNELREIVCVYTRGIIFSNFYAFSRFDPRFLRKVMLGMKVNCYSPSDIIFVEGEKTRDLFYILEGTVVLEDENTGCLLNELKKSYYFGEIGFFFGKGRCCCANAKGFLETFVLHWEDFSRCLEEEPEAKEHINKLESIDDDEIFFELQIECYICKQIGHISKKCDILDFGKSRNFEKWRKSNRSKKVKVVKKVEGRNIPVRFMKFKAKGNENEGFEVVNERPRNSLSVRRVVDDKFFLDSSEDSGESVQSIKSEFDVARKNSFDVRLLDDHKSKLGL